MFERNLKDVLEFLVKGAITAKEAVSGYGGIAILAPQENPIHPRLLTLIFESVRRGEIDADFINENFLKLESASSDREYLTRLKKFLELFLKIPEDNSSERKGGDETDAAVHDVYVLSG